ncbi:MAG TPA: hypothetical protein VGV89_10695 [Thermoplasmata archaeon]|nr:hypothetical protein [Thermoplasmata archaeon]
MKPRPAAVLIYPAALVGIAAALLYLNRRRRPSTRLLGEIRDTVHRSAASSQASYRLLKQQRRTLQALSGYLLPVPKRSAKPAG